MREQEVIEHRCAGMTNKQAAWALFISDQTVKNTLTSVIRKMVGQQPKSYHRTVTAICWHHGYEAALQDVESRLKQRSTEGA